jgi:hypothetical protein
MPVTIGPNLGPIVVNRDDPLNVGRVWWWLVLPHTSGGGYFKDIVGNYHLPFTGIGSGSSWVGSVNQSSPSSPYGVTGSGHHGGFGACRMDNANFYAGYAAPAPAYLRLGLPFTAAFWVRALYASPSEPNNVAFGMFDGSGGGASSWYFYAPGNNPMQANSWSGSTQHSVNSTVTQDNPLVLASGPVRFLMVVNSSGISFYRNNYLTGTLSTALSAPQYVAQSSLLIGGGAGTAHWDVWDATIWNRQLSTNEIARDYYASSTGYLQSGILMRKPIDAYAPGAGTIPLPRAPLVTRVDPKFFIATEAY